MKLSIGFSPCPNDTFIFEALIKRTIDTGELEFEPVLEDVETLNRWALDGKLDITKLSFPAFFQSIQHYKLLDSGSALGIGVGPLLVTRGDITLADLNKIKIAIPGLQTTANFLLDFAFPEARKKIPMLFSEIEDAVVTMQVDAGVIIHENRFTYQDKGLKKLVDLGEHWETRMQIPVPLGGIAVNNRINKSVAKKTEQLIYQSLTTAWKKWPEISDYVRSHSQAMSDVVMRKHIELYVNDFSLSLGKEGKKAVGTLYNVYLKNNTGQIQQQELFL